MVRPWRGSEGVIPFASVWPDFFALHTYEDLRAILAVNIRHLCAAMYYVLASPCIVAITN